ncbi:MAG TPA: hypothetical protein VNB54_07125, partial [Alphaproteobacteria bacterium]|nr:hypothetical protein [Alphaproteobacteria bacterium]
SETRMKKIRIMYIESKGEDISGPARIGRVTFSKSEHVDLLSRLHISKIQRRLQSELLRCENR